MIQIPNRLNLGLHIYLQMFHIKEMYVAYIYYICIWEWSVNS